MAIDVSPNSSFLQPEVLECLPCAGGARSRHETGRRPPADGRTDARIVASPAMDFILAVARYRYAEARERMRTEARDVLRLTRDQY
jgi:hypothetical protein